MPASEIFAAFRWWLALMVVGAAATPLAFVLFKRLPDRGYAFVKMVGLLIVSYLFWMFGSLGLLGNNLGSILVALLALVGLSVWVYRKSPKTFNATKGNLATDTVDLKAWLKANQGQVILTELVFLLLFGLWVWVRSQNPAISATEKPMEFAFLNSIGRSPQMPPLDPWLSGFAISYYYFGYVMSSVLARLAFVPEMLAFNLSIAWLVAGTGIGAFGLVYNLVALIGDKRDTAEHEDKREGGEGERRANHKQLAWILGLVAALAIPVVGNLEVGLEVAYANNIGSPAVWAWLDVRDLNTPPNPETTPRYTTSSWWWWRSSRPIHEYHLSGRAEEGLEPIVEVPSFSFILGDMHPHVLALPFALLSLAVALAWWLEAGRWQLPNGGGWTAVSRFREFIPNPALWLFTALLLGGLSFLNTWDFLIHLFVVLGAFFLARWQVDGWRPGRLLLQTIIISVVLLIPIILLYLPFYLGFRSQAGAPYLLPMLMRPTRLSHFLIIFGMPLWSITFLLLALGARQRFRYWRWGLVTAVALILILFLITLLFGLIIAVTQDGSGRVLAIANELGLTLPARTQQPLDMGWGVTAVFAILPALIRAKLNFPAMTLYLGTLIALIVMIWPNILNKPAVDENESPTRQTSGSLPFALLLIFTAALLTLGPEFVYLRDNFGQRLNTIFKFYYQAWVLFGIAALFSLGYLWVGWRGAKRWVPLVATLGYGFAFTVALLFPIYGVNSRAMEFRGQEKENAATLNGLAQIQRFNPDEYEALLWLRELEGTPVILEAVGGQYSGYGRYAANTGLPTVLGWAGHEYQWRGDTPEPAQRETAVRDIYSQTDLAGISHLLNQYAVEYIIVGNLEREAYDPIGLEKFTEQLDPAFTNNSVTIYHWNPTQ